MVSAAKTHLRRQYGQWSRLWKSGQKIPVSKSTADKLALIGEAMGDLDSATSLNLPRGWNILYCLAQLNRQTLEQLIRQNVVHPELTLREARELVVQFIKMLSKVLHIGDILRRRKITFRVAQHLRLGREATNWHATD